MKKIKLTQGQFALVDDADFAAINQWKWQAHWSKVIESNYAMRRLHNAECIKRESSISMSRQIMRLRKGDKRVVDHLNHNTLDNRRCNLKVTSYSRNLHNNSATGHYWHKKARKWVASIQINGKQIHLGYFTDKKKARKAYIETKNNYLKGR